MGESEKKRRFSREHVGLQGSLKNASMPDPTLVEPFARERRRLHGIEELSEELRPDAVDRSIERTDLSVRAAVEGVEEEPSQKPRRQGRRGPASS